MSVPPPQKGDQPTRKWSKNDRVFVPLTLLFAYLFPQMMSCAPFDNKAERAFQALSYNQLKAAGLSIEAKSKEKHQSVEVWQGPAESIRIRFATSNVLTRWNVYVEAFSRRKGKWCHETYWYDERTKTIQEYTFYPMNLDDAAFSKKYGNDQHQI